LFDGVWTRESRDLRRAVDRVIEIARAAEGSRFDALRQWLAASATAR
jgi:hypothetical protein